MIAKECKDCSTCKDKLCVCAFENSCPDWDKLPGYKKFVENLKKEGLC